MTKSLVINCSWSETAKIQELLDAIGNFSNCSHVRFRDIHSDFEVKKDIDAIILSGSKARIVNPSRRRLFRETVSMVQRFGLPTLGICFGMQLICWALGCEPATLSNSVIDSFEEVRVLEVDELFAGYKVNQTITLAQSHHDYIKRDSIDAAGFLLLADSPSCEVEAVKHRHNPFYGVQFHPERIEIKGRTNPEGHQILENFFRLVVRK
jgi:GMP synthase (glutamine-hydrolysing)